MCFCSLLALCLPTSVNKPKTDLSYLSLASHLCSVTVSPQSHKLSKAMAPKTAVDRLVTVLDTETSLTFCVTAKDTDTIANVKAKIVAHTGYESDRMFLSAKGKSINGDKQLGSKEVIELAMAPRAGEVPKRAYLDMMTLEELQDLALERGHPASKGRVKHVYVDKLLASWIAPVNTIRITVTDLEGVVHIKNVLAGDNINMSDYHPQTTASSATAASDLAEVEVASAAATTGMAVEEEELEVASAPEFFIRITLPNGRLIEKGIKATDTIADVKAQIAETEREHPAVNQRLTFASRLLVDSMTVGHYNIIADSKVKLTTV